MASATKELTVEQQRRRTEKCPDCKGWGFIPGHDPMKICHCIVRTKHMRPAGIPKGTKPVKDGFAQHPERDSEVPESGFQE